MTSPSPPLRFFFDVISPYAYLGWTQIHRVAERHGRAVDPIPVLFAGLLGHHGTKGPAEVPAKQRYLVVDTVRKARALGVPFGAPFAHPFSPLVALRVLSVPLAPDARRALVTRIFDATWSGEARSVEARATVADLVTEVGLDAAGVLDAAESAEGKARLRAQTDAAIAEGVFGVPSVLADGELFWGVDALPELDRFLATGSPTLSPPERSAWVAVRPTATRRPL